MSYLKMIFEIVTEAIDKLDEYQQSEVVKNAPRDD